MSVDQQRNDVVCAMTGASHSIKTSSALLVFDGGHGENPEDTARGFVLLLWVKDSTI
jgi:hypothetical protein